MKTVKNFLIKVVEQPAHNFLCSLIMASVFTIVIIEIIFFVFNLILKGTT